MRSGQLKCFNHDKGYGFINQEGYAKDMFVHISDIGFNSNQLNTGMKLQYDVEESEGQLKAVNVTISIDELEDQMKQFKNKRV